MDSQRPTSDRAIALVAIVMLAAAVLLGFVAAGNNELAVDLRISSRLQNWQGDFAEILYDGGNFLGSTVAAIAAILIAVGIAALLKSKRFVAFFVLTGILRLAGSLLKPMFDSPRPVESEVRMRIVATYEGFGFPSGHSMTAAMIATILVIVVWMLVPRKVWIAIAVGALIMIWVGWSRIWGGAHWPTDVLGGWMFGIAIVLFGWLISSPIAEIRSESAEERSPASPEN